MEGLGSPPTSLGNLFDMVPLVLEVNSFQVPVINFVWHSVEGHDSFHEWGRDPGSKEANEDIVVHDASVSGVAPEG